MEISQVALARLYWIAILVGVGLAALYDALRITRVFLGVQYSTRSTKWLYQISLPLLKPRKKGKENPFLGTVIFFEDFFFGIFCGISMILLFYEANNGNIRWLAILCTCGGFFAYRNTVGRVVMLFSEVIAFAIGTAFRYLFYFLISPFRWIAKRLYRLANAVYVNCRNAIRKKERIRYTASERVKFAQAFDQAFGQDVKSKRILKRGRAYGKHQAKKAVQPEHADAHISRSHGNRLFGHFRKQRDEI